MYPTTITANSPAATVPTEIQNGAPKNFHNSNPTINPFATTGNKQAIAKCLENIIPTQAITVAKVPKPTSTNPMDEAKFAIAQPIIKPIE